jgi:hypothetical protein
MRKVMLSVAAIITIVLISCKNEGNKDIDSGEKIGVEDLDSSMLSSFGDQPAIAHGPDGFVAIAFGHEKSIYYSESVDKGASFSEPVIIGSLDELVLGYSSGPQIAITTSTVVITAPSKKGNLFSWTKERSGSEWEGPYRINDVDKSVEEYLSAITSTDDDLLFCTWIDTRFMEETSHDKDTGAKEHSEENNAKQKKEENLHEMTPIGITKKELYEKIGDVPENVRLAFHNDEEGNLLWVLFDEKGEVVKAENHEAYKEFKERNGERVKPKGKIYISSSADGGRTWTKSRMVYKSPGGSVCECCKPSIESDSNGNLVVMFRNNLNGSRDLYYAMSMDKGRTFSEAQKLGSGTWKINGCPMDGGGIVLYENGGINTIWSRKGQIYTANSDLAEQYIGIGRSPSISSSENGSSIVFKSGEDIMAMNHLDSKPVKIGSGNSPKVATIDTYAIYVWVNKNGIQYRRI